jgi:hypothetical protein
MSEIVERFRGEIFVRRAEEIVQKVDRENQGLRARAREQRDFRHFCS